MFSSDKAERNALAVALKLTSGVTVKGYLSAGITGKLADLVNKADPFVELVRQGDTAVLIAKSTIAEIEPLEVPKTDQLSKRLVQDGIPDPHDVLGVSKAAGPLDIQSAYHNLARRYHPDHFSGREIPPEVLQYVSAMFKRITAAYNDLKAAAAAEQAAAAAQAHADASRAAPTGQIYTN